MVLSRYAQKKALAHTLWKQQWYKPEPLKKWFIKKRGKYVPNLPQPITLKTQPEINAIRYTKGYNAASKIQALFRGNRSRKFDWLYK